nr:MAG TPA: hypothetical protein [Caudoviricetes sp.]
MGRRLVYQPFHLSAPFNQNCTASTICFLSKAVNDQYRQPCRI